MKNLVLCLALVAGACHTDATEIEIDSPAVHAHDVQGAVDELARGLVRNTDSQQSMGSRVDDLDLEVSGLSHSWRTVRANVDAQTKTLEDTTQAVQAHGVLVEEAAEQTRANALAVRNLMKQLEGLAKELGDNSKWIDGNSVAINEHLKDLYTRTEQLPVGCAEGMVQMNGFCIDQKPGAETARWADALAACYDSGMRLCSTAELYIGVCRDGLVDRALGEEWTDGGQAQVALDTASADTCGQGVVLPEAVELDSVRLFRCCHESHAAQPAAPADER